MKKNNKKLMQSKRALRPIQDPVLPLAEDGYTDTSKYWPWTEGAMPLAQDGYTNSNQYPWYPGQKGYGIPQGQWDQNWQTPMSLQDNPGQAAQTDSGSPSTGMPWMAVGNAVANIAGKVSQMGNQAAIGSIYAANALLPEHKRTRQNRNINTYNPYPNGTGSQAIYANGGYVEGEEPWTDYSTRSATPGYNDFKRNSKPTVSYDMQMYETPEAQHIPYQQLEQSLPEVNFFANKRSRFGPTKAEYLQPLYDNRFGEPTLNGYLPQGQGMNNFDFMNNIQQTYPDYYNNVPVNKSRQQFADLNEFKQGGNLGQPIVFPQADSGIHIDPKNKGKFNALKKRTGKSTEELTHSKNPLTRKRAIFAQNSKKFNHSKKAEYGMNVGDEIELSQEELQHYKNLGYEFE